MFFYPKDITKTQNYKLMTSLIVPRPIAFISTKGKDGSFNLAPFSFFNGVTSSPPIISVAIAKKKDKSDKDTLRNIKDTKEFVVNIVSNSMLEALDSSATEFEYGVDEFIKANLNKKNSKVISSPMVKECSCALECRLYRVIDIGNIPTSIVLASIVCYHAPDEWISNFWVDEKKIKPLSRISNRKYVKFNERCIIKGDKFK